MGRKNPQFSYSELSDASDVLLRQEPERQEPEEEEDEEEDDENDDTDDDEEEGDGYSACRWLVGERLIQRASHDSTESWMFAFLECRDASMIRGEEYQKH